MESAGRAVLLISSDTARDILLHERLIRDINPIGALLEAHEQILRYSERDGGRRRLQIGKHHRRHIALIKIIRKIDFVPKFALIVFVLERWHNKFFFLFSFNHTTFALFY